MRAQPDKPKALSQDLPPIRPGRWNTAAPFGRVLLDTPLGVITWEVIDLSAGAGVRCGRTRYAE
jgi:hypothetical protein